MHKIIANLFSSILSFVHFIAALTLILVLLAIFSGVAGTGLGGGNPEQTLLFAVAMIIGYVLIFGFLSVVLRMHENQERIARGQEDVVAQLAEISEAVQSMPAQMANAKADQKDKATANPVSVQMRKDPPLQSPVA
ncbi:hypothetical protein [Sulfitobacter sp. 1A16808]|uniref:hypothetical protein n=1 Tax=Sulfitobacter sp. 1A16808 TaxID=3368572 RepID=UPI003747040C